MHYYLTIACNPPCEGLGRCRSSNGITRTCCSFFNMDGSCVDSCPANSTATTATDYVCECDAGFQPSGSRDSCEDINECTMNNPCQNGGNCTNLMGSFSCACPVRFTGSTCMTPVICDPNPCENEGTCMDAGNDDYTCTCAAGFTGQNCSQNVCDPNPCQNGSTCVVMNGNFSCHCPDHRDESECIEESDDVYTTETTEMVVENTSNMPVSAG